MGRCRPECAWLGPGACRWADVAGRGRAGGDLRKCGGAPGMIRTFDTRFRSQTPGCWLIVFCCAATNFVVGACIELRSFADLWVRQGHELVDAGRGRGDGP